MPLQVLADYRPGDKRAPVHFVGLSPFLFPFVPHSCMWVKKGQGCCAPALRTQLRLSRPSGLAGHSGRLRPRALHPPQQPPYPQPRPCGSPYLFLGYGPLFHHDLFLGRKTLTASLPTSASEASPPLALALHGAKPRLWDHQRCFPVSPCPSSLTGAFLVLRTRQTVAIPIGSRCGCWLKKRTISAEASGPLGSVYEPEELPPDQACPSPWTVQRSKMACPPASR